MAILLLLILVTLLFFMLLISRLDVLSPNATLISGYIVGVSSFVIANKMWNVNFSLKACTVILTGICAFCVCSTIFEKVIMASTVSAHLKVTNEKQTEKIVLNKKYLNNVSMITIFLQIIVTIQTLVSMRKITGQSSITGIISAYREGTVSTSLSTVRISSIIIQEQKVLAAVAFVLMFYLFYFNVLKREKISKWLILPTFLYSFQQLLMGGRLQILRILLMGLLIYYFCLVMGHRWNKRSLFKTLKIIVIVVIIAVPIFYLMKFYMGRSSSEGLVNYILRYVGGSTAALSIFLNNFLSHTSQFGQETFMGIYDFLGRQNSMNGLTSLSWAVSPNGTIIGNVYGADRRYFSDFGIQGVVILNSIMGCVYGGYYGYLKGKWKLDYVSPVAIIIYSFIFYTVFFQFIEGFFFMSVLSVNTITQIIMIAVVFFLLKLLEPKKNFYEKRMED